MLTTKFGYIIVLIARYRYTIRQSASAIVLLYGWIILSYHHDFSKGGRLNVEIEC